MGTAAVAHFLKSHKPLDLRLLLLLVLLSLALLELHLHVDQGRTIERAVCDTAMLESAAIVSRAVVVVALANDLTTANDDTSMAIVEWRFRCLLKAEREVIVRFHFDVRRWVLR